MTGRTIDGAPLTPGVNVDPVDVSAGLERAKALGYDTWEHLVEVGYNLRRWRRGEEAEADRSMSRSLSGVSYNDWRVILAAAIAGGKNDG